MFLSQSLCKHEMALRQKPAMGYLKAGALGEKLQRSFFSFCFYRRSPVSLKESTIAAICASPDIRQRAL